jgi:hypothetical protein
MVEAGDATGKAAAYFHFSISYPYNPSGCGRSPDRATRRLGLESGRSYVKVAVTRV